MEPGEALSTAAQIAVALAGFAGVVVAFRRGALHEWAPLDKHRLWLLLGNALLPFLACLFAMLLLTINPAPASIWRWSSGFTLVCFVAFALLSRRRQRELGPALIKEMGGYRFVYYLLGLISAGVGLMQVYNALVLGIFWLFYAAIVFQLALGALQFARMIVLPGQGKE